MKRDRDVFARDERRERIYDAASRYNVPVGSFALWREGLGEHAEHWEMPKSTWYGWTNPHDSANTRLGTAVTSSVPVLYVNGHQYSNVASCQSGVERLRQHQQRVSRENGRRGGRPKKKFTDVSSGSP